MSNIQNIENIENNNFPKKKIKQRIIKHQDKYYNFSINSVIAHKGKFYLYIESNKYIEIEKIDYIVLKNYKFVRYFINIVSNYQNKDGTIKVRNNIIPIFSNYDKDPEIIKKYLNKVNVIGRGTYGKVVSLADRKIAIKVTNFEKNYNTISQDAVREISIYSRLRYLSCSPQFLNFDINTSKKEVYMSLELGYYTLYEWCEKISKKELKILFFNLFLYFREISNQGIIHCDLKPHNIIINKLEEVKVIDWGISEIDMTFSQTLIKEKTIQTLPYRSPEIFMKKEHYNYKIDVYSLGLIFLEMYTDIQPFRKCLKEEEYQTELSKLYNNEHQLNTKYIQNITTDDGKTDFDANDLVYRMLEFDPEKRIDYNQILAHPYFKGMSNDEIPYNKCIVQDNYSFLLEDVWLNTLNLREYIIDMLIDKIVEFYEMIIIKKKLDEKTHTNKFGIYNLIEIFCLVIQIIDIYISKKMRYVVEPEEKFLRRLINILYGSIFLTAKIYSNFDFDLIEILDLYFSSYFDTNYENNIFTYLDGKLLLPTFYTYWSRYNKKSILSEIEEKMETFRVSESLKKTLIFIKNNVYLQNDYYMRLPEISEKIKL